jgi:hypothetical protein
MSGVLGLEARPFQPAMMGITALVIHILVFGVFSAIFSVTHPHAVIGIHDVNDVLPMAILDAGALLWLVRGRRSSASKIHRTAA